MQYLGCVFLDLLWCVKTRKAKAKRHYSHTTKMTTQKERNRKRRKKRSFAHMREVKFESPERERER